MSVVRTLVGPVMCAACLTFPTTAGEDDPFADAVEGYVPGVDAGIGYTDPSTAVGAPERFTGELFGFDAVVSAFSPPFGTEEIVSIGRGGELVLRFDTPVTDDPDNLYGVDLLVFGNTGFIDAAWPAGIVGNGYFGADGGAIEVSADGKTWFPVAGAPDGPFPTLGYLDAGPYDVVPGAVPSDFTRPVDPGLSLADFTGLDHAEVVERYRGAGGGIGVDIASTGLESISYVRILNPAEAETDIEIDAVADAAPRRPGDVTLDGLVDVSDLLALLGAWGDVQPGDAPADFDGDGEVNVVDLLVLLGAWDG